jgi:hypothetical protein
MVDFKKYRERLENKICEAKVADKVIEVPWEGIIIKDLNQMSHDLAHEIGVESAHIGRIDPKDLIDKGTYKLPFEEWSHGRLTAINLILSYWLGFQSPTHDLWDGLGFIQQAYFGGLNEFLRGAEGKQWLQRPKGEQWLQTAIGQEWKKQQQQNATSKSTETTKDGTLQQSNAKTEEKA